MEKPTKEEIQKFLDVFKTLNDFEAQHRMLRRWGAFKEEDCPMPAVQKVLKWIKEEFHVEESVCPTLE